MPSLLAAVVTAVFGPLLAGPVQPATEAHPSPPTSPAPPEEPPSPADVHAPPTAPQSHASTPADDPPTEAHPAPDRYVIDAQSGRDLDNFPPHRLFDFLHLRLAIDIPDMDSPTFIGDLSLSCTPLGGPRDRLVLSAAQTIKVESVRVDGLPATFTHEGDELAISLPAEAEPAPAAPITVNIRYRAERPSRDGAGLVWTRSRSGERARPAQIFSQGEPEMNRYWIPSFDFPSDRQTTELLVTVADGFTVVSNGRLIERRTLGDGRVRWHWLQSQPHVNYLIMLAVGKFEAVELNPGLSGGAPAGPPSNPSLPLTVLGPEGTGEAMRTVYARTPEMVSYFERLFDEPYPWDKYAQVVVRNFRWGGMENTSATIMSDVSLVGGDQDDLISHELAHQWTGDLVTTRSWAHLWLNEGWATFAEALWAEQRGGQRGYNAAVRRSIASLRARYREHPGLAPRDIPMVSRRYDTPDDVFQKADDVYAKGGFILHMLRRRLGEDAFWRGTRLYLDRYKFTQVETDDLRRVYEEVSGESLERFFAQWCYRPGVPNLNLTSAWDESAKELKVTVEQTQPIDDLNPAYAFRLPIRLDFGEVGAAGEDSEFVEVPTQERVVTVTFPLKAKPTGLSVDPQMTVLANFEVAGDVPGKGW